MISKYGMEEIWLGGEYPEVAGDSLGSSSAHTKDHIVGGDKKRDVAEQKDTLVWSKPSRSGVFTIDASDLPRVSAREMKRHAKVNIFISPDFYTAEKLLVIVQGSGAVRPGQWARALCINHSLKAGTIFDYLDIARELGMATIVLNPNQERLRLRVKSEQQPLGVFDSEHDYPILGHETHVKHILCVWDKFVVKSDAKDIWMVAHSRGGDSALQLLNHRLPSSLIDVVDNSENQDEEGAEKSDVKVSKSKRKVRPTHKYTLSESKIEKKVGTIELKTPEDDNEEDAEEEEAEVDAKDGEPVSELRRRLRALAFTDSVHWIGDADSMEVKEWVSENARDWVMSKLPLDAPEPSRRDGAGCDCFSSGHEKHEWTSPCAVNSVFKFFMDKDVSGDHETFKPRTIPFSNPPQNMPPQLQQQQQQQQQQPEDEEEKNEEETVAPASYADIAAGKRRSVANVTQADIMNASSSSTSLASKTTTTTTAASATTTTSVEAESTHTSTASPATTMMTTASDQKAEAEEDAKLHEEVHHEEVHPKEDVTAHSSAATATTTTLAPITSVLATVTITAATAVVDEHPKHEEAHHHHHHHQKEEEEAEHHKKKEEEEEAHHKKKKREEEAHRKKKKEEEEAHHKKQKEEEEAHHKKTAAASSSASAAATAAPSTSSHEPPQPHHHHHHHHHHPKAASHVAPVTPTPTPTSPSPAPSSSSGGSSTLIIGTIVGATLTAFVAVVLFVRKNGKK